MNRFLQGFFAAAALAASGFVVWGAAPVQAADTHNVCLNVIEIKNTRATSRRTIEFTMIDGKVWRNDLISDCPDLVGSSGAFSERTHTDWICANQQQIVTEYGNVCRLGEFTRVR